MKVVILAGGLGTRICEETTVVPKPMISLYGKPILLHIIEFFYSFGYKEFIICSGYKSNVIKQFFIDYIYDDSDIEINTHDNSIKILDKKCMDLKIKIIDTGIESQTAFRIKSVEKYIGGDNFILTYGDGLANVDINQLVCEHKKNNGVVTLTAVKIRNKFGLLDINEDNNKIKSFEEKKYDNNGGWINGGFMIVNKSIFNYLSNNPDDSFEFQILPKVAENNELFAFKHYGFWKCMDTLKDKIEFEKMISSGEFPWKKK